MLVLVDLRVLGNVTQLSLTAMRPLMKLVWWAFLLNLVTGLLIFASDAERYYGSTNFRIKIASVLLAIGLAVPVQRYLRHAGAATADAPSGVRLAAGSSIGLWAAAGALARGGASRDSLKVGDEVTVVGNPGRSTTEYRIRLNSILRPADGWKWSGDFD